MGTQKIGRYEIEGMVGKGAMGVVYKAFDPLLERHAAIKVMSTGGELDDELRSRFFQEARSAARLSHPNIISIFDLGEDEDRPFIAMEYVEGADLKEFIQRREFVPFPEKLRLIRSICAGLDFAHHKGVIHRDIKPGNIFLTKEGEAKILDFGLARLGSSEMTRTGMLMGSPYYMSPEQVKGSRELDGRSDLFSLGVVFFELLCYQRPFEGETPTAVCYQIVSEAHPSISDLLPGCSEDLKTIVDQALAKNKEDRFQSCGAFSEALDRFEKQLSTHSQNVQHQVSALKNELTEMRSELESGDARELLSESMFEEPAWNTDSSLQFDSEVHGKPEEDYGELLLQHGHYAQNLDRLSNIQKQAGEIVSTLKQTRDELEAGDVDKAERLLKQVIEAVPEQGRPLQEEIEGRRAALGLAAQVSEVIDKARAFEKKGHWEACLDVLQHGFQLDPDHAELKAIQARVVGQKEIEIDPVVEEGLERANKFIESGQLDLALGEIQGVLKLDPENAKARGLEKHLGTLRPLPPEEVAEPAMESTRIEADSEATALADPSDFEEAAAAQTIVDETGPTTPSPLAALWPPNLSKNMALGLGGSVAALLLLILGFILWPGAGSPPVLDGQVTVRVTPWAHLDQVIRLSDNQTVPLLEPCVTPCVLALPPGDYRFHFSNPFLQDPLEVTVAVAGGQPTSVQETFRGFHLDDEISAFLEPNLEGEGEQEAEEEPGFESEDPSSQY